MKISEDSSQSTASEPTSASSTSEAALKAITYSLDILIPSLYLWCGPLKIGLGGTLSEASYPGKICSFAGFAVVLPGYRIYSTYQDSYDPP